jgi:small subunit ribosomal protein S20
LANHKSAIKRAKQSEARRLRNRARKTRLKNVVKDVHEAIVANSPELAAERLSAAISVIDRTAGKGVIHKNSAARKISRLTKRVNGLTPKAEEKTA